jgi:hypothetical protein
MRKPRKPVRSCYGPRDAKIYYESSFSNKKPIDFKNEKITCTCCRGEKKIQDFTLRVGWNFISCPKCSGSGLISKDVILLEFKEDVVERYKDAMDEYIKNIDMYRCIKSKLTKEEINWLTRNNYL